MTHHLRAKCRAFAAALLSSLSLLSPSGPAQAATASALNASADAALAEFASDIKGGKDYLKAAKGILVLPEVTKAGLVVAAQFGEGALRVGGKTVDFYKMEAASVGLQAGYQEATYVFLFLTDEALNQFRTGKGWSAGVEGGVTVVDASMGGTLDSLKAKDAVLGFAFGETGLMGGWSAKGAKFTKIQPDAASPQRADAR